MLTDKEIEEKEAKYMNIIRQVAVKDGRIWCPLHPDHATFQQQAVDTPLQKSVGRIAFPKILQKLTRPDQQVRTVNTPAELATEQTKLRNMVNKMPQTGIKDQTLMQGKMTLRRMTNGDGGMVFGDHAASADHDYLKEHEGLHVLQRDMEKTHGFQKTFAVFHGLRKLMSPDTQVIVRDAMRRKGYDYNTHDQEILPAMRDVLANPSLRQELKDHHGYSDEEFLPLKRDWKLIIKTARNMT